MGNISQNVPDVIETIRIVHDLGGRVVSVSGRGHKHIKMSVVTRLGNSFTLRLSKGKTEPYKLKGWTRQQFNRADRAQASNRRSRDQV